MLKANQDYVRHFEQCGSFPTAASYQRGGIKLQEELLERGDVPSASAVATMRERLAGILIDCESLETDEEAMSTLKALLEEEVARGATESKQHSEFIYYPFQHEKLRSTLVFLCFHRPSLSVLRNMFPDHLVSETTDSG